MNLIISDTTGKVVLCGHIFAYLSLFMLAMIYDTDMFTASIQVTDNENKFHINVMALKPAGKKGGPVRKDAKGGGGTVAGT